MSDDAQVLDELESLLAKQIELTRTADTVGLAPLMKRLEELSKLLPEIAARLDERHKPQLERIRDLHRRLGVSLAGKKQQLGDELKKVRSGKSALRAYRPAR